MKAVDRPDISLGALIDRPVVLLFADYTCQTLCSPMVAFVGHALAESGLQPDRDYRLVVIGLDPKDSAADARAMRDAQLGSRTSAAFLLPDGAQIKAMTDALGYRATYDQATDQFAHPAAAYVLDHSGKVVRVLSGLGVAPADLRLALVEAGHGAVGTVSDQVHLLCYGFDPAHGMYNLAVSRLLSISAAVSVAGLGGLIGVLVMSGRRRARR